MTYFKIDNGKILTENIEYSVSYHCNLRCSSCSHLSPFVQKKFPPLESYQSDIKKLNEVLHASKIHLLGGEPLLNPEISSFVEVAKKSSIVDIVCVTTNGLLLHTMNDKFWEYVDRVDVSMYPGFQPKEKFIQIFKERALESNTILNIKSKPIFRTTLVTEPHPRDWITYMIFNTCKAAHTCNPMIYEGKIYKCWASVFLPEYLLKIKKTDTRYKPENDSFDIHHTLDIAPQLKNFLSSRVPLDACRFCLGFVGKMQIYHQLEKEYILHPELQNIQRVSHLDAKLFLKGCVNYYYRQFLECLIGMQTDPWSGKIWPINQQENLINQDRFYKR